MKTVLSGLSLLAVLLSLSACAPKEGPEKADTSFPLVPKESRSPAFEAIGKDLDLGGDFFYFKDFGTAFQELGDQLNAFMGGMAAYSPTDMGMMMAAMFPYDQAVEILGISELSAIGASSYREGASFRNKSVVYLPGGAKGLFALFGEQPHAFDALALAPADADIFVTQDIRGRVLAQVVRDGAEAFMPGNGEQAAAAILGKPVSPASTLTIGDALDKSDTVVTTVVRFGAMRELTFPMAQESVSVPQTEYFVQLKGMSWLVSEGVIPIEMNVSEGTMTRTEEGDLVVYQNEASVPAGLPLPTVVVILDTATGDLTIASSRAFFDECRSGKSRLADTPAYQAAVKGLPTEGNGLTFVSQKAFQTFITLRDNIVEQFPQAAGVLGLYEFVFPVLSLDKAEAGAAAVTVTRPDSIFSDARWPTASAGFGESGTLMASTGVFAAMAIPAFNKVRETSREKTITNNLRQVASAGQLYLLEEGATEVTYPTLVEKEYFMPFEPVDGESYDDLVIKEQGGTLEVITDSGTTVEYAY